jgi:hypothetical protein
MQIRQLKISAFRGIATLEWNTGHRFCCLIGPGDCGKSTVLDGVEAVLSPRWFTFAEADFYRCDTTRPIVIEVTVGELSKPLKSDERFGLYIRGWTAAGELRDEPEDDDEPVLTVRLTVDATMEPVWELICDRVSEPRTLSNRDRALFGVVRLAGDDSRHLAWGQGSVLARMTGETDEAADRLAEAYRTVRASTKLEEIKQLADAAGAAERHAKTLGAYVEAAYLPGLELGRSGLSSGSIALHDGSVPLRLAGLGTRRLATLGVQKCGITEGAIVLIDEVEHGLEPHRIIGVISQLHADQKRSQEEHKPLGQVLLTTHSDVALAEAGVAALRVVNAQRPDRKVTINVPSPPAPIHALMRFAPRSFFARRIVAAEGNTELGMLLGLRREWPRRHAGIPVEQLGVAIVDGNGDQAPELVLGLAALGYTTVLYRDSDKALAPDVQARLAAAGISTIEYGHGLNTEKALFSAASDDSVQALLEYARAERGSDSIDQSINACIPDLRMEALRRPFAVWSLVGPLDGAALRDVLAEIARRKKWFKDQRIARDLAPIMERILREAPASPLAQVLARIEAWAYA